MKTLILYDQATKTVEAYIFNVADNTKAQEHIKNGYSAYTGAWKIYDLNGDIVQALREKRCEVSSDESTLVETDISDKAKFKGMAIANLTLNDVDNYIDTNVTDLASARTVLKVFGKAILLLARKTLR